MEGDDDWRTRGLFYLGVYSFCQMKGNRGIGGAAMDHLSGLLDSSFSVK